MQDRVAIVRCLVRARAHSEFQWPRQEGERMPVGAELPAQAFRMGGPSCGARRRTGPGQQARPSGGAAARPRSGRRDRGHRGRASEPSRSRSFSAEAAAAAGRISAHASRSAWRSIESMAGCRHPVNEGLAAAACWQPGAGSKGNGRAGRRDVAREATSTRAGRVPASAIAAAACLPASASLSGLVRRIEDELGEHSL